MPKKQTTAIVGLLLLLMSFLIFAQQQDTLQQADSAAVGSQTSSAQNVDNGAMGTQQESSGTTPGTMTETIHIGWVIGSIVFLLGLLVALFLYMLHLQKKFLKACEDEDQLPMFINAPAGLPPGSIRTILTFLIVVFLLFLVTLQAFKVAPGLFSGIFGVFTGTNGWLFVTLIFLFIIIGGFLWYMFYLQKKLLKACEEKN